MKNKTTAGILALLLGGLGVHKFYLGNTGKGILYLCFFWTFIPAIIALIEGIQYLTMSDIDFDKKYNNGQSSSTQINVADELEKLHGLKEKGIISNAEFEAKKKQLL